MELGTIFYENEYNEACCFCFTHNYTIQEIEANENGRRFKIIEIPQPTESELAQQELTELKEWYDIEYERKEQKYRRLHTLGKLTDEGNNPYDELIALYQEAETKRARIQELERLLSDNSK